jgi:hypothetical protein
MLGHQASMKNIEGSPIIHLAPSSIKGIVLGGKTISLFKIYREDGQWCLSFKSMILYTNQNALGDDPPRDGWSRTTKGLNPAPICIIGDSMNTQVSDDGNDDDDHDEDEASSKDNEDDDEDENDHSIVTVKSKMAKKRMLEDDSDSEGNKGNVDESDSTSESTGKALFDDSDSDNSENEGQVISGIIQGKHGGKRGKKFIHAQKVPRNQQQPQRRRQQPNDKSSSRVSVQCLYHSIFTNFPRHINQSLEKPSTSVLEKLRKIPIIRNAIPEPTKLNTIVSSWSKSTHINQENQFFEESVGEDGLSSQSTYENSIEDASYNSSICHFKIFLREDVIMDDNVLAMIYSKLVVALTDLRTRITSKNTLSFTPNSGKTINTHLV